MNFSERMKGLLDQGVSASKDFAVRAGEKAQELGERGILMLEIKQLEGQAQKIMNRLGTEAYRAFVEDNQTTISSEEAPFKGILTEMALVKETIEKKDAELQSKKK